ncbi:MAG: hypothetical protein ABFD52_10040 [Acidobacteriota bacterium]
MRDHIKIIGILWIVFGVFYLCLALFAFLVFFGVAQIPNLDIEPGLLRLIGLVATSFLAVIALPQIVGGLGLINHKEWARILMLVVSFLNLFHVPFGTALGVYSLIILFNPATVRLFQGPAPAPDAPAK